MYVNDFRIGTPNYKDRQHTDFDHQDSTVYHNSWYKDNNQACNPNISDTVSN